MMQRVAVVAAAQEATDIVTIEAIVAKGEMIDAEVTDTEAVTEEEQEAAEISRCLV